MFLLSVIVLVAHQTIAHAHAGDISHELIHHDHHDDDHEDSPVLPNTIAHQYIQSNQFISPDDLAVVVVLISHSFLYIPGQIPLASPELPLADTRPPLLNSGYYQAIPLRAPPAQA